MTKRPHRLTLANHLATWDVARLARLLELRPDLVGPVPPTNVDELGQRAQNVRSIDAALGHLRSPELTFVELIVSLRPDVRLVDLAAALPEGLTLADVEPLIERLDQLALAWKGADRLHWSGALTTTVPSGLGPPVRDLVDTQPVDFLRHAIAGLRAAAASTSTGSLPPPAAGGAAKARKADLVDELEALIATPGLVDAVLEAVSPEAADLARALGVRGGYVRLHHDLTFGRYGRAYDAGRPDGELFDLALLLPVRYDGVAFVPREAGVSLRGGRPVASLDLDPAPLQPHEADQAAIDTAAGAAVATLLHRLADVLARWADEPAKVLKAGGIGVTVMRGVAAALDVPIEDANRLVELLALAGLLQRKTRTQGKGRSLTYDTIVMPAPAAEAWLARPPAVQWRQLATAWQRAEHWPSDSGRKDEPGSPAVLVRQHGWGAASRRGFVLDATTALPEGQVAAPDRLVLRVAHDHPWAWRQLDDPLVTIGRTLDEAVALGVAALARPPAEPGLGLSSFGRALLAGDHDGAEAALAANLPAAGTTFLLQADLTITVVGALDRPVLTELRLLADVESTGAATTLRLSEPSIRRALDAGRSAEEIHAFLAAHAAKGVPKPVAFLVDDAARRHGHLQVGDVRCFVTSSDPAVLADACSHRRTRKLKLRVLAPTVAVSTVPAATVLDGLRDAGFSPVADGEDPAGVALGPAVVDDPWDGPPAAGPPGELPEPFRLRASPVPTYARPGSAPAAPPPAAEVAAALHAAPRGAAVPPAASAAPARPASLAATFGRDLAVDRASAVLDEVLLALATGGALMVEHDDDAGAPAVTLLTDALLDDPFLVGVDIARDADVEIELGSIVRVVAVEAGQLPTPRSRRTR